MTYLIVPGKDQKVGYQEAFQLQYIGDKVLFNPSTAVVDGMKELERMASLAYDNLNRSMNALITLDDDDINQVYEVEKNIDFLNNSITQYFVKINQSTLPIEDLKELGSLFHVANDIERIGDHAENIADMAMRRKALGVGFSADAQAELAQMMASVDAMIEKAIKCILTSGDKTKLMMEISELEGKIDSMEKQFQQHHIDRLTKQQCTAEAGMIFSDVISGLERVSDHALNIVRYLQRRDLAEITE
jgi:phosphate:Na+ symporter